MIFSWEWFMIGFALTGVIPTIMIVRGYAKRRDMKFFEAIKDLFK